MKKKLFYVDLIKVVAIFLVVFLHIAGFHLTEWNKVSKSIWMIENIYNSFTRMCVPLFMMISGATLLSKEESYIDFFKKRFSKIFIPAIFWTGVYLAWRRYSGENISVKSMFKLALAGPVYYHLWFLYAITGMYLITPILRKMIRSCKKNDLVYAVIVWFIFVSAIPTILRFLKINFNISLTFGINLPMLTDYVGYFILGYMLTQVQYKKKHIVLCWIGSLGSWFITSIGTYYIATINHGFSDIFYSYFSITVVVQSITMFALMVHYGSVYEDRISNITKFLFSKMAMASFGVYLVHALVSEYMRSRAIFFTVDSLKIRPIISNPLAAIEVFIISNIIVFIMLKIPIVNLFVGGGHTRRLRTNKQTGVQQ